MRTPARIWQAVFAAACGLTGVVVGALFATMTVGPRFDTGIDNWLGPLLGDLVFRFGVVAASVLAVLAAFVAWKRRQLAWLALGATAFVVTALFVSFAFPRDAGQGPVVSSNVSSVPVLIRLETIGGSWLVNPNDQVTLLDNRPADIRGVFLYDPATCAQTDLAIIRQGGPVLITVGDGGRFAGVSEFSGGADGAITPAIHGCPAI